MEAPKLKIATHDSCTGEKCIFLSYFILPFAKTQSKTIHEQLEAGCRLFDLRAKTYKGEYHPAHGGYIIKRTLVDVLTEINDYIEEKGEDKFYATLTYEGRLNSEEKREEFMAWVDEMKARFPKMILGEIIVKHTNYDWIVDWVELRKAEPGFCRCKSKFKALNGKNWQSYIPIPWLWKKIYFNVPEFSEDYFTYVDFL